MVRAVVADEVMALKAQDGGDLVLGGADLAASFARLDRRIWRTHLRDTPLGRGKPMFAAADAPLALTLAGTRRFGNGVVLLRYERRTMQT